MSRIEVRVFGPLRDITGTDSIILELPSPGTGVQAFESLATLFPAIRKWEGSVKIAVNLEYASLDTRLQPDDEVCFLPPVSGG